MTIQQQAAQAFSLLDLTSLTDTETLADIEALAQQAQFRLDNGDTLHVAALCVLPRFIPFARHYLDQNNLFRVRLATVANFPSGHNNIDIAVAETRACIAYGADEVDLVFPYHSYLAGNEQEAQLLIAACKAECGHHAQLKVILETGELATPEHIQNASQLSIAAGADFIKTSTGKVAINATPAAAEVMLQVIAQHNAQHTLQRPVKAVGFKPAGGIRTLDDALIYIQAVTQHLGAAAVTPSLFRLGASSLRNELARLLVPEQPLTSTATAKEGY